MFLGPHTIGVYLQIMGSRHISILAIWALVTACGVSDQTAVYTPKGSVPIPTATSTPIPVGIGSASTDAPTTSAVTSTPSPASARTAPTSNTRTQPRQRFGFVPLDDPVLITALQASYLESNEMVLGLEWKGETRAYPLQQVTFHHIVNETIQGTPLLVTF